MIATTSSASSAGARPDPAPPGAGGERAVPRDRDGYRGGDTAPPGAQCVRRGGSCSRSTPSPARQGINTHVATGIGEQLSAARSARGIELEEVEERTKIRKRYLRAMEEERWELLPGAAYARAFLRTYAEFLALDGGPGRGVPALARLAGGGVGRGARAARAAPARRGERRA
jgi:hypothetical protein